MTRASLEGIDSGLIAVSGTVDLPSNANFTSGDDYEVECVEGDGSCDVGTKTATTYDVTVGAGGARFVAYPAKIGATAQVT